MLPQLQDVAKLAFLIPLIYFQLGVELRWSLKIKPGEKDYFGSLVDMTDYTFEFMLAPSRVAFIIS